MAKNLILLPAVLFFALIGVLPLFHPGLHPTHDGEYHIIRFYEFDKTLRSGILYPRWAQDLNNGYGIPLFNFVYPLPNYAASILHFLGLSLIDSFKMSMALATLLGAVFMYFWSREFWGSLGGLVSSVVYSFAPYRFVDIYVRGSVGEVWAMAFAPLILWALTKAIRGKNPKFFPVVSLGIALLVFSHNILALLFFGFTLIYTLLLLKVTPWFKSKKNLIISLLLGVGLAAIFWIPALVEKKYTVGLEVFSVARNFVELYQLLIPSWGSGFSQDLGSGISFQIGLVNLAVVFLSICTLFFRKNNRSHKAIILFCLVVFLLASFLMLPLSKAIWALPLLRFFQFPWRLLSLVILISAFLGGALSFGRFRYGIAVASTILAIVTTYSYTLPAYYHDRDDNYYISRDNFLRGTNSPGNAFNTVWFRANEKRKGLWHIENGEAKEISIKPESYIFDLNLNEASLMTLNTAYFPGWRVFYDKNQVFNMDPTRDGRMSKLLPAGKYRLNVFFADTIVRQIGFLTSVVSILVFGIFSWKLNYENRHR